MKTLVCGDIHCDWSSLNTLINKQKPDLILQCGDWGWWPHLHGKKMGLKQKTFDQFGVKNNQNGKLTKIFWCPGNHENWNDLNQKGEEITEVQHGIFYCPFGTLIELPDGRNVMFVGGADSIDKSTRIEGISWWRDEIITQEEMDRLPETNVDIVISHTVPRPWFNKFYDELNCFDVKAHDPSTFALGLVFDKYRPKKWFSGHFHKFIQKEVDGCLWTGLDMSNNQGKWWIKLKN